MDPNAVQNIPSQLAQTGNPLDQLKDIHLPDGISMWPIAWPWWALLISVIALTVFSIWFYKKNKWKKAALAQLQLLKIDNENFAAQANRLLKQICLGPLKQSQCAHLSGAAWLDHLNATCKEPLFTQELQAFAQAPDNPNITLDHHTLKTACENWIKQQVQARKSTC